MPSTFTPFLNLELPDFDAPADERVLAANFTAIDTAYAGHLTLKVSAANAPTPIAVLPNGSATQTTLVLNNTSDPLAAGRVALDLVGSTAYLRTSKVGAGVEPASIVIASVLGNLVVFDTLLGTSLFSYPVQAVVTTPNDTLYLQNNDGGATGVLIGTLHASPSPAVNDAILRISGRGKDSNGNNTSYGYMTVYCADPVDGSEDAYFMFTSQLAGVANDALKIDPVGSIFYKGGLSLAEGNLSFGTTFQRLQADFTNANHPSRLMLRSSTANGETTVGLMPNGSSTTAGMKYYGLDGAANCAVLAITVAGTSGFIDQNTVGSGTQGSLSLRVAGATVISLGSGGQLGFFTAAGTTKPTVTGSKGANAALASLCAALAGFGLITDSTS